MDLIKKAIFDYIGILHVLKRSGYWGYMAIIAIISTLLGIIALFTAYKTGALIADYLTDLYPFSFSKKAADTFFHLVPFTYIFAVMFVKYVIFIAVSPLLNKLSRKLEHNLFNLGKEDFKSNPVQQFKHILRIAGRAFYKEILWTILFSVVGIIVPVAGIFGFFITQSYYIGSCYTQLVLARKKPMEELLSWTKENRGLALGNGAVYLTILLIPFLGLLLASSLSVFAATKSVVESQNI